jgi:hypothetical protein
VLWREGLERKELLDVPEAERELPIAERDDLCGDVRLQDPASIHSPSFPVVFFLVFLVLLIVVGVIHFGIRRRQFLEHQVRRLNCLIQEAEDPSRRAGSNWAAASRRFFWEGASWRAIPAPFHHPATRHRPDGPDGVPTSFVGSAYRLDEG